MHQQIYDYRYTVRYNYNYYLILKLNTLAIYK